MRPIATSTLILVAPALIVVASVGCSHSGGSGGGGLSVAPTTSNTSPVTSSSVPLSQSFAGTWTVTGTDPRYGAFSGTAVMAVSTQGYSVQRLVTYAQKLPDGRSLVEAWDATATVGAANVVVQATLRQADFLKRVGTMTRGPGTDLPLQVEGIFTAPGGGAPPGVKPGTTMSGLYAASGWQGASETWTFSTQAAPPFPVTDLHHFAFSTSQPGLVNFFMSLFKSYHTLPDVAPYVSRPEFQAALCYEPVDRTAKDYYRQAGPTVVVIYDKVTDAISILEETQRANAFSYRLFEKAQKFEDDLVQRLTDSHGMIGAVDTSTGARWVSGDGALHQGVWVASQAWRYKVTGDPQALTNVENGVTTLCIIAEIDPDVTQFARAIQDCPSGTPPQGWTMGTGNFAGIAWLPGGNNDMLHGLDYGFMAALSVLPSGHPLLARIAADATSLLNNVKIAGSGDHAIFQSYVAWQITGDPAMQSRHQGYMTSSSNILGMAWLSAGDGIFNVLGVTDWSGHHLGECDLLCFALLGGANPTAEEQTWKAAAVSCAKAAYGNMANARMGLLDVLAGASSVPGAAAAGKEILEELPYPKFVGDAECDLRITSEFCMCPFPSDPWKNDWMTNRGREQGIEGRPYFQRGCQDNVWNTAALDFTFGANVGLQPAQDFLNAYWFARYTGQIGPND
ncbi:MAG TPA: hypothetical protein VFF73_18190 [Planctomycetota bacterium]|nr:hypothetical protein [Planctomycetota bacterium]